MKDLKFKLKNSGIATKKIICLIIFLFLTFALFAFDSSESVLKLRQVAMEQYRQEISLAASHEIPAEDLGGWNEILNSTLFLLIRKTELYRGRMRILIEQNDNARCRIYPDGTILISTAIFDYIDAKLADTQNLSPRRIKNFNIEREKMLASFLAHQVANFAEENLLLQFSKQKTITKEELKKSNLKADEFAVAILKLAGYDSNLFYNHLEELKQIRQDASKVKNFTSFFEEHFDPQTRIGNLLKNINNAETIADEVSAILESLQNGTLNSLEDAKQRTLALQSNWQTNIYFKRLSCIISHKKYADGLSEKNLLPAFPVSMHATNSVNEAFKILNLEKEKLAIPQTEISFKNQNGIKNINEYDEAVRAYKFYLNSIEETGILSSYALLLSVSDNLKERADAFTIAEKAYLTENKSGSFVAALNYATLLYSTGKNYTEPKIIMEEILNSVHENKNASLFLRQGVLIDERILLFNYARILFGLGEIEEAENIKDRLKRILFSQDEYETIFFKKISLGSTTDELIEYWGEPPLIEYNYFLEKWHYSFLNAIAVISQKQSGSVEKIIIRLNSNLTMPDDLRVGESRRAFEQVFGKPIYYSGDFKTYFYKGNKIQIFFINDYAREVIISKI